MLSLKAEIFENRGNTLHSSLLETHYLSQKVFSAKCVCFTQISFCDVLRDLEDLLNGSWRWNNKLFVLLYCKDEGVKAVKSYQ